jgi:hypothetical protein
MKKVLSILNSSILTSAKESWLSIGSIFVDIYPKCIILSVLGLLFLFLRYLILKPFLPTQTSQGVRKVRLYGDFLGALSSFVVAFSTFMLSSEFGCLSAVPELLRYCGEERALRT